MTGNKNSEMAVEMQQKYLASNQTRDNIIIVYEEHPHQ